MPYSIWIFAIAVHTYFAIVKDRQISNMKFFILCLLLWAFDYTMAIIGVATHPDDFYVRAGAWVRIYPSMW